MKFCKWFKFNEFLLAGQKERKRRRNRTKRREKKEGRERKEERRERKESMLEYNLQGESFSLMFCNLLRVPCSAFWPLHSAKALSLVWTNTTVISIFLWEHVGLDESKPIFNPSSTLLAGKLL